MESKRHLAIFAVRDAFMHEDLELAAIERALRGILVQLSVHLAEYRLDVLRHGELEHVYDGHLDAVAVYSVLPDRQLFKGLP